MNSYAALILAALNVWEHIEKAMAANTATAEEREIFAQVRDAKMKDAIAAVQAIADKGETTNG